MSEVTLTILDCDRAIHGKVHGSDADRAIAALAAEPETIEELDVAMRRFTDYGDRSHFGHFCPGDSDQPWDAGVVIIDLAARLIAGESSYSAITTSGSVRGPSCDIDFRLSEDWEVLRSIDYWRHAAQNRRQERAKHPRIDVRQVLFGLPMVEFIAMTMPETRQLEAEKAVAKVHADWLMTTREDLDSKSPRDLLLQRQDFLAWDLQYRQFQWSTSGECPPGLGRDTAAYQYAGFGTHETVTYYELMRHLLWKCRARLDQEADFDRADEVRRLETLRDSWLEQPDPEFHGRTPASIIDNERQRIPEGVTGAEAVIDPDCPCCQMMAEEFGPSFWHLDGCEMDDEFAFSFYQTKQEWDEEQRKEEQFNREFEEKQARRKLDCDTAARVWNRSFADEEFLDSVPLQQLLPIATFAFAAMVAELNQDMHDLASDPLADDIAAGDTAAVDARSAMLNRLLGNLREALRESAELIDPTLDRLVNELTDLAEQYPSIGEKCADLSRRLQEFPAKLASSAELDDIPF